MKYVLRCPDCFSTNIKVTYKAEDHDFVCSECDEKHKFSAMDFEELEDDVEE